jgi:multidrug efflux system outer membrane protein
MKFFTFRYFIIFSGIMASLPLLAQAGEEIVLREVQPRDHISRGSWWSIYDDEILDSLIRQASTANQNIKVAVFRFDQSRAAARLARSQFFPQASINASATRQTTSGAITVPFDPGGTVITGSNFDIPLDVSYEIDFWGRVRKSVEASINDAASTAASMQNVMLSVQAEVAQNYFMLRAVDAENLALKNSIALLTEAQNIALAQQKSGTATEAEVTRANSELLSTQAELAGMMTTRDQLQNSIAVLVGKRTDQFSLKPSTNPLPAPPSVPTSIPSDLLERRPDIATSERALSASIARVGVAKLAGYPSIRLTGSGGVVSGSLSSLFATGSEKWSIGPSISIPILSGGKNKANLEAAIAAADLQLAQYRQTILLSFAEVDNNLSALKHLKEQITFQNGAYDNAEKSRALAKTRYESGLGQYLDLLEAGKNAITTQRRLHQMRGQNLVASVTLIKALGGGWNQKMPTQIPVMQVDPATQGNRVAPEKKKNFFQRLFKK